MIYHDGLRKGDSDTSILNGGLTLIDNTAQFDKYVWMNVDCKI